MKLIIYLKNQINGGYSTIMNNCLYIIIPCYNEEEVLPITSKMFLSELNLLIKKEKISNDSKILFIDDGSSDSTWKIIKELSLFNKHFIGISQSRNRGHQSSLLAGLMEALEKADITISIDCDGQDDISIMETMIDKFNEGYDIVYGVRNNRSTDSFFKRNTAKFFYKALKILGAESIYNHADYRLLSKRVLQELVNYNEVNLYLRGLIPLIGFKYTYVYYTRHERLSGKTHYSLGKMTDLALNGITNLSIKPLRIVLYSGIVFSILSFIGIIWAVIDNLIGNTIAGWTSIICIICFIGSIQLISIGIIGEYVGKIYLEVKHRPRYIISERTDDNNDNN